MGGCLRHEREVVHGPMLWCHGCCYPLQGYGCRSGSLRLGAQDDYWAASGHLGRSRPDSRPQHRPQLQQNVALGPPEHTWLFHVKHGLLRRIWILLAIWPPALSGFLLLTALFTFIATRFAVQRNTLINGKGSRPCSPSNVREAEPRGLECGRLIHADRSGALLRFRFLRRS